MSCKKNSDSAYCAIQYPGFPHEVQGSIKINGNEFPYTYTYIAYTGNVNQIEIGNCSARDGWAGLILFDLRYNDTTFLSVPRPNGDYTILYSRRFPGNNYSKNCELNIDSQHNSYAYLEKIDSNNFNFKVNARLIALNQADCDYQGLKIDTMLVAIDMNFKLK